jgi:hypothetical protein
MENLKNEQRESTGYGNFQKWNACSFGEGSLGQIAFEAEWSNFLRNQPISLSAGKRETLVWNQGGYFLIIYLFKVVAVGFYREMNLLDAFQLKSVPWTFEIWTLERHLNKLSGIQKFELFWREASLRAFRLAIFRFFSPRIWTLFQVNIIWI